jgi:hypothetical protein
MQRRRVSQLRVCIIQTSDGQMKTCQMNTGEAGELGSRLGKSYRVDDLAVLYGRVNFQRKEHDVTQQVDLTPGVDGLAQILRSG